MRILHLNTLFFNYMSHANCSQKHTTLTLCLPMLQVDVAQINFAQGMPILVGIA